MMKGDSILPWLYLGLASVFEVAWLMALKYLNISHIMKINWFRIFKDLQSFIILLPLICYIVFGICNIYFFSEATKKIPIAIAFSIWLSLALVITTIVEYLYFKVEYSAIQFFFLLIIIICVIGLKLTDKS